MDLGMEKAGFHIPLASEIDTATRETIKLNRPNVALLGDITGTRCRFHPGPQRKIDKPRISKPCSVAAMSGIFYRWKAAGLQR